MGSVASEVVREQERKGEKIWVRGSERRGDCQMFTHFSELFALSAGRLSAHNSLPAGLER